MNKTTSIMEVEHNTEPETSTAYESTTTVDSDDDTASSAHTNDKFVLPKVKRLGNRIHIDQNYAEFIKPFQTRLIAISLNGTQNDLLNFLDIFWEKLRRERNTCFTKSKATKFLCRRINHILLSVRSINKNFLYNSAYFIKMSRILAIYMDLELKASSRGTEYGVTIIERMQYMLKSHLTPPDYHHQDEYILQTFIHMERLVKAHKELVDLLFNRFIKPKSEIFDPKIMNDRMYITYLALYKKWIDIETSAEFKKKIIEVAKKHILPQQTLKTNLKYAPYLPNWAVNQNPTEFLLASRMKFSPLIDALKIPDNEDNFDVEIIDFRILTPAPLLEDTQSYDNTTSITNSMSSTNLTNSIQEDQITVAKLDERKKSREYDQASSSSPSMAEISNQTAESIIIQPKKEPDDSLINQDGIIDLTADEVDVGNFEDIRLSWINVLEPKSKCSLMLPPQNYEPRKVIDKIIIIDDDDDDEIESNKKIKQSVDSENSSDSNLCNFLGKNQSITNSSTETTNSGYSITSPTDSGIIMTNSGRNTVCSLYDEELTDCGLTSNDEHEPKPSTSTTKKAIISKCNTDTDLEVETDWEMENLSENITRKSQVKISHDDDSQLAGKTCKVDKLNDNCDEILVNSQNSELLKSIEPTILDINTDNSQNLDKTSNQIKLRCGPITKTYQSNKKRSRNLTPTIDNVNCTTVSSPILVSSSKTEITLDDDPIVLKTSKIPTNKGGQSNACDSTINTGAVVFSMLPRQKPMVSSNFPNPANNVSCPATSTNVVYSTPNPNAATESSKVSSLIIKDWTKPSADDDIFRPDGGIDSDFDDETMQPTNILIRCNYFKTESKPSASPFSTRANSPYANSFIASSVDKTSSSKTVSKTVTTVRKTPAGSVPFFNLLEYYSIEESKRCSKPPVSRNKRVAFASSIDDEYKTEKVDEKNNLKIRFKKQPAVNKPQKSPTRRPNSPVKKSILKKLPKPKPCSVLLNKLPVSNKHIENFIRTVDSEPGRVASILIRRNSTHSINKPFEHKQDDEYSVWRRDYTTDYDDVLTEQRKMNKKKKTKRKRSRSLTDSRLNIKKLRKQEIVQQPQTKPLSVIVKPLNLNKLFEDPNVNIKFEVELEANNAINDSFEINSDEISSRSTPKFNMGSDHADERHCSTINHPEFEAVEKILVIEKDYVNNQDQTNKGSDRKITAAQDIQNKIEDDQKIEPKLKNDVPNNQNIDNEITNEQDSREEIMNVKKIENKLDDLTADKQKADQNENDHAIDIVKNNEPVIYVNPSLETQLCDESIEVSTLRFTPEPDPSDDETVVSTTYDIQEEIETEVVESVGHAVLEDIVSSHSHEILQIKKIEVNEEIVKVSLPQTEEIITSKSLENEYDSLNVSGASEEIQDTNKILTQGSSGQLSETFPDRLNTSGASDEINDIVSDTSVAQSISRMLRSKAAKILTASSCLDEVSICPKNGVRKNGRDTPERSDQIESSINKNIITIKSSVTTTAEDEFLMDEYIDDDEIVVVASNVELNNHRSEGDQSCTSEEIPSPPFETVIPKLTEKMDDTTKKLKMRVTTPIPQSSLEVSIESPPFDEVLDLKSFGTLENDSSISEMENVGKRVNDNFNEIDEDEENDGLDMNADTESLVLPENQLISTNQNDVTTTTLSSVQKKKNLVHRPYNRHIKINNKKRNSSSNSSSSDIPETIVSSTTVTTNHLVAIANQVEFNGTNNSSTTYNLFCQLNHEDCPTKKRRGRPKGSKNKRKDATPQMTVRSDIFQYSQITPPTLVKPLTNRRQTFFYQHHEISPSSCGPPRPMIFNNNPPYRPPYNASEESLNQINRNRSLPSIQPFHRNQNRLNFRTPSCDSDEQPLIHLKHHHPNPTSHHGYTRKHKKLKRHDSNSPPFSLEKQFGVEKDLLDSTKTYLKVQEARTIFVPEDIDKLIQNQTTVEPSMNTSSPITSTYHRYDPGGGGGSCNNGGLTNCANTILSNSNSGSLSDPITQSHQFVSYDTSSSPERILTQHEHNYSNDR